MMKTVGWLTVAALLAGMFSAQAPRPVETGTASVTLPATSGALASWPWTATPFDGDAVTCAVVHGPPSAALLVSDPLHPPAQTDATGCPPGGHGEGPSTPVPEGPQDWRRYRF
ncbi:TPA: hypothetical protein ACGR4L_004306 [Serratia marcescens]|uniref:hypothetical protein n=1 Tax=Serratia marcescens TaxID=615 RepID=UPI000951CB8B|nr:hypothetical protein [Serratia marcescens]